MLPGSRVSIKTFGKMLILRSANYDGDGGHGRPDTRRNKNRVFVKEKLVKGKILFFQGSLFPRITIQ